MPSYAFAQPAVEVHRSADQSHVCERLWVVSKRFPGRTGLLGIQAEMVRIGEHLFEDEPGLVQTPSAGQRLAQPKGTHIERPFLTRQSVTGRFSDPIAIDQAVG